MLPFTNLSSWFSSIRPFRCCGRFVEVEHTNAIIVVVLIVQPVKVKLKIAQTVQTVGFACFPVVLPEAFQSFDLILRSTGNILVNLIQKRSPDRCIRNQGFQSLCSCSRYSLLKAHLDKVWQSRNLGRHTCQKLLLFDGKGSPGLNLSMALVAVAEEFSEKVVFLTLEASPAVAPPWPDLTLRQVRERPWAEEFPS